MKYLLSLLICISANFIWSQEDSKLVYNRPYVIYQGCEDAEDKKSCYDIMLHEFLAKHINKKNLKDSIFSRAKKDTITMHTNILYDEKGYIVKDYSSISNPVNGKFKKLETILDSIPKVKPVLDSYDNGVSSNATNLFGFLLDRVNDSIVPILGYIPDEVPFSVIEKVPVYKGCKKSLNNKALRDCMNEKIQKHVAKNFNIKIASKLDLNPGVKRIFVLFKIDKEGNVIGIKARGPHVALEDEAIRVIKTIPKLKKPGYQRGKAVIVPYSLPIVFRISE
ncbi:hypothetical protein [Winogradskyella flava]|uniref:TonB protein C-terminal n=1 Tax=Winogradskyella flava TaxID=1884876 RepID=A0A842IU78_9FLAO|nr:hypothetical protein [Winogradskyella flava]MBC2846335.1 hypothetical protein [Winogradskyella flava]